MERREDPAGEDLDGGRPAGRAPLAPSGRKAGGGGPPRRSQRPGTASATLKSVAATDRGAPGKTGPTTIQAHHPYNFSVP